jgi:uncharacterized protein
MANKKNTKNSAYYYELRRLDEQGGGDHTMTILLDAAQQHNEALLRTVARERGINYTEDGKTALFWLAGDDNLHALELLLQLGAKLNAAQTGAASPLMHAAYRNRMDNVQLLVRRGAAVDYTDANGDSALSFAEAQGHIAIVDYLKHILAAQP